VVRLGCGRYTGVNHFGLRDREGESLGGRREPRPRVSLAPQTSRFITESAGARAANGDIGDILLFLRLSGPAAGRKRPARPNPPPSAGPGPPAEARAGRAMPPRYTGHITRYNRKKPTSYTAANA